MLTEEQLSEIRARDRAAHEGPWFKPDGPKSFTSESAHDRAALLEYTDELAIRVSERDRWLADERTEHDLRYRSVSDSALRLSTRVLNVEDEIIGVRQQLAKAIEDRAVIRVNYADLTGDLATARRALEHVRQQRDNWLKRIGDFEREILAVIASSPNPIHVSEGGGPEDVCASLAVTVLRERKEHEDMRAEQTRSHERIARLTEEITCHVIALARTIR